MLEKREKKEIPTSLIISIRQKTMGIVFQGRGALLGFDLRQTKHCQKQKGGDDKKFHFFPWTQQLGSA